MIRRTDLAALILERITEIGLNSDNLLTVDDVLVLINTILHEITVSIAEGRNVSIRGFGTFKVKAYKGNTKANIYRCNCPEDEIDRELYFARPTFKAGLILRSKV